MFKQVQAFSYTLIAIMNLDKPMRVHVLCYMLDQ